MGLARWQAHFKKFIPADSSEESLIKSFNKGLLDEEKYLKWAKKHFKLPVLSSTYFESSFSKELYESLKEEYPWEPHIYPLNKWRNVIYVGCLEPPKKDLPKGFVAVLCKWSDLQKYNPIPEIAAAEAPKTPSTTPPVQIPKEESSPNTVHLSPKIENPDNQFPEEITQAFTPPVTDPPIAVSEVAPPTPTAPTSSAPEPQVQAEAAQTSTDTHTVVPFPDKTSEFTFVRTVYSDQVILDAPKRISECSDPNEALVSAFRHLHDYYNKLLWAVRDAKGRVYPIACDTHWVFNDESWNQPLNLKAPNPFRIAKLTKKPFHGPISKNASSDEFFQMWNENKYPDHMTIMPVQLKDKVFGYFVGCGRSAHYHDKYSLDAMTLISKELIEGFVKMHADLKKAS